MYKLKINMILPSLFFNFGPGTVKAYWLSCDGEKYKDTNDALLFL